ncbi:unnamed protein product [Leptosia nina]|uniref:Ig-like domain-containing protein n=1 Tax=Leptosia nina TaxID=320188 RepID=A0AAV1JL20_9NEOP
MEIDGPYKYGVAPHTALYFSASQRKVGKMWKLTFGVLLAASLCYGLPTKNNNPNKFPVLKETRKEVLYRVSEPSKPFLLECVVLGNVPGVKYTWHKNGKPLAVEDLEVVQRHEEGTLVFLRPKAEDAGEYQCFATTELGKASTGVIHVKRAYINAKPAVLKELKPVEAKPLKLECNIPDAYPKPNITWRYQSVGDPEISSEVLDARMTFSPEGSLYITSVAKEDANRNFKYVCVARTPASSKDLSLAEYVIEEVQPNDKKDGEIQEMYTSKDMTVKVGDRTFIYCIFGGFPQAYQDYYKDGEIINSKPGDRVTVYNRSKGKRLLIRDTYVTDAGTYKCVSSNKVGKPKEHTMKLTVVAAPHAVKMPPTVANVAPGLDFTFHCSAEAVPAPKITWTYNAEPLTADSHFIIVENTKGNLTTSDLTIKAAEEKNKGYYGCKVENEHGVLYAETAFRVA